MVKAILTLCFSLMFSVVSMASALQSSAIFSDLQKQISEKILQDYSFLQKKDLKITIENEHYFKTLPENASKYDIILRTSSKLLGRTVIPIKFYDKNGLYIRKEHAYVFADAKTQFFRSNKRLKKGDVITQNDITSSYELLYGKPLSALRTKETIIGKEVYATIPENSLLTTQLIRAPLNIHNGDNISIIIEKNNIQIKVTGVALEDGKIGDKIRIKSKYRNEKLLTGEIINETSVKVVLPN